MLVRNVSYMGMNLLRTVGLVQFSLPEHHRYNVKWAVTHGNNFCRVYHLLLVKDHWNTQHILILVHMYVLCRPTEVFTKKLDDDPGGKDSLSQR